MPAKRGSDPFAFRGRVRVQHSAVVLCVRRSESAARQTLTPANCGGMDSPFLQTLMPRGRIVLDSGWEVLMGQSSIVNWLKTTPDNLRIMRYAGEWKLAGGNVDEGENIIDAAKRELYEEFLAPLGIEMLSSDVHLWPFVTKQTRPIRGISNLMHCFIALEDENAWLKGIDVDGINRGLEHRRQKFAKLISGMDSNLPSAPFFNRSMKERETLSPEVQKVKWLNLGEALRHSLSSMVPGNYVDSYQQRGFAKYNVKRRDPMFITAAILMELEGFPNVQCLLRYCRSVNLDILLEDEQWLFDGMSSADVSFAFAHRTANTINPSFKTPEVIEKLKKERLQDMDDLIKRADTLAALVSRL